MKIAIVGASKLTENWERDVRQICAYIMQHQRYAEKPHCVISGGAIGVDTIAIEVAKGLGLETEEYLPGVKQWEDLNGQQGYKSRNLEIVKACDILYCIVVPFHKIECYHHGGKETIAHEKTAGCWTMERAIDAGKEVKFFVTTDRSG